MCRFCECKYSFKLTFLQRKLEFYTKVHKKDVSFVALYIIKSGTLIYDHITIVLALHAQYWALLSNFFMKQYFFVNSNHDGIKKSPADSLSVFIFFALESTRYFVQ